MNYLLKNKPKRENIASIIYIIASFLFLTLVLALFPNAVRRFSYTVTKPIWFVEKIAIKPFSGIKDFFVSKNNLISKNLALENEINDFNLKLVDYDVLSKENETFKNLLGRSNTNKYIIAGILSRPPTSPYDSLVIDAGSFEGALPGNKVYLSDNIIIGLVTSVTPHTSLVSLFSTGGKKQEAVLLRTGTSFIISGRGGSNFSLEVPKDTDILWGDLFMYPGLKSSLLGNVYYIDTNSQSSFKTVYLRVPGNVFSSKYVFIE